MKTKVALEALKGQLTSTEIASRFQVHPSQTSQWKRQALEVLPTVFSTEQDRAARDQKELTDNLYQEIGRLKAELDWLQKGHDAATWAKTGADRPGISRHQRAAAVPTAEDQPVRNVIPASR